MEIHELIPYDPWDDENGPTGGDRMKVLEFTTHVFLSDSRRDKWTVKIYGIGFNESGEDVKAILLKLASKIGNHLSNRSDASDNDPEFCAECQHQRGGIPTGETIDITPVGCQTPEGVARVAKAKEEWDSATYLLANTLRELMDNYVYGEGFTGDELHQLKALIGARDRKQEAFLRAVAGK